MKSSIVFISAIVLTAAGLYGAGGDMGTATEPLTDGSADYPWLIEDFVDFEKFAADPNLWAAFVHTKLICDLDLDPNLPGRQIYTQATIAYDIEPGYGFQGTEYEGAFDGNGHVIVNLTINGAYYCGLFGKIGEDSLIKNLSLENSQVKGTGYNIGGICGSNSYGAIDNCHVNGTVSGDRYIGNLCGTSNIGTITNCSTSGSVNGGLDSMQSGGLCGYSSNGTITNCSSNCSVTGGNGSSNIGGLCGYANSGTTIRDCDATGDVNGGDDSKYLGGLCGRSYSKFIYCYATGQVTSGDGSEYIGGLCGGSTNGLISRCYATGLVYAGNSSWHIGGLCGKNIDSVIKFSNATGDVNGGADSHSIGGLLGSSRGTVQYCYAIGTVFGGDNSSELGGLCGYGSKQYGDKVSDCYATGAVNGGTNSYTIGGLFGRLSCSISRCYSIGPVTGGDGSRYLGGLCGSIYGSVPDCYYHILSGPDNGIGIGLDQFQMQQAVNYTGFDFDTPYGDWTISNGYCPKLSWQSSDEPLPPSGPATTLIGSGLSNDPYQINNCDDFTEFRNNNRLNCGYYILNTDIDLSGESFSTAVIKYFGGYFNGNGMIIRNIAIDTTGTSSEYLGLFSYIAASVSGLGVENINIIGEDESLYVGGLCGYNSGAISECYVTGTVNVGNESQCFGGLSGKNTGTINNCYAICMIDGGDDSSKVGGLTGDNSGEINNCYTKGEIMGGNNSQYLGGLAGVNFDGTITNCYAIGPVTGGNGSLRIGALCGDSSYGTFINSYFYLLGGPDNGGGRSLDEFQILDSLSFEGFDFASSSEDGTEDDWMIVNGHCPKLAWQNDDGPLPPEVPETSLWGTGYQNDPFQINDSNDFMEFRSNNKFNCGYYILNDDIDLSGECFSDAVINYFGGHFDGNGMIIRNICIDTAGADTDYLGLFSYITSSVSNLNIENINITGGDVSKSLGAVCGRSDGTITNCSVTGEVNAGLSSQYLGGICGENWYGTISNCRAACTVIGGMYIGGVCGLNRESMIVKCDTVNPVTGSGGYVGGICGNNYQSSISKCFATGNVKGEDYYVAGLCGYNNSGDIDNCYATGMVDAEGYCSGLGGLCGYSSGTISNCYATGAVNAGSSSRNHGGLCGDNYKAVAITNSFWDVETSQTTISDGGSGLTTDQMQTQLTFTDAGWDFVGEDTNGDSDIWRLCTDGLGYPRLAWEYSQYGDFVCGDGVDSDDFAYFEERYLANGCGGIFGSEGGRVDLGILALLAKNWLRVECGECGGADISDDGNVNAADVQIIAEQWLCNAPVNWDRSDLNNDGVVNETDLDIWIDFWLEDAAL